MEPTRRVVTGLTAAAIGMIALGAAAVVFDSGFGGGSGTMSHGSGTTPPRSTTPSTRVTPTGRSSLDRTSGIPGTPVPLVTPSPAPPAGPSQHPVGFAAEGNRIVYYAADGTVVPVKQVPGLEARLQSGRALYYALSENQYDLPTGAYAGEFKPLVTMGQVDGSSAETGGIVLTGMVAARLVLDKLASIQSADERWIVALPVDIRSADREVQVAFDQFGVAGSSNTPRVIVRFAGSLPLTEAIPSNDGYHILVEQVGATAWQVIDPTRLTLPPNVIDPAHAMNELVIYGNTAPEGIRRDIAYDDPVSVGEFIMTVRSDVSVSLVVNGSRADLGPNKILTVGDVPVFVARS